LGRRTSQFSQKDRAAINLRRDYSLNQVEYGRNFVFRRPFPIHKIFERSCELGVFCLTADKRAPIFGVRKHKRRRGKLHRLLEKLDPGHPVLRVYCKSLVARRYEKFSTFLRLEISVHRMKDLGLNKDWRICLPSVRSGWPRRIVCPALQLSCSTFRSTSRCSQRWAPPVTVAKTKIAGIKIQDTRMIRLMEVPRHGGPQLHGWRTTPIHEAILSAFGLSPQAYSLTQLRYDLRKMKAHGLGERPGRPYCYRLTPKASGWRPCSFSSTSAFVGLRPTACSTTARSKTPKPPSKIETAYQQADNAIQKLIDMLAA